MSGFSVFDIIGPKMTGPSSSHTAGACRLANVARRIAGEAPKSAHFTLYGSFAQTGKGHGTDKALIAGTLNMLPDDPRICNAYDEAKLEGLAVSFSINEEDLPYHPNTAKIELTGKDGKTTQILGASIGGGNIKIEEINGLEVEITGDYPTLVIQYNDVPGMISVVTHVLAQNHINIAFMRVFRHGKGADAYMTIETDQPISPQIRDLIVHLSDEITA
ncbi:L-serine ammonia-lyase, iron-sulfur-dependent subunit beta, partial [Eubacteriales bacterium OttesenSCG-928-K08]|nr:L-serine ammonia-lyase, iron-sulfur-dependent subunit beta [Eubacteriales bacterium OttesenSCG-928-K08]